MPDIIGAPTWHETVPCADNGADANQNWVADPVQLLQDNAEFLARAHAFGLSFQYSSALDLNDDDAIVHAFSDVFTFDTDVTILLVGTTGIASDNSHTVGDTVSYWGITAAAVDSAFSEVQAETPAHQILATTFTVMTVGAIELNAGSYKFYMMAHRTPGYTSHLALPANQRIMIAGAVFPRRPT